MAHGPGSNQKGDDQPERVQVVPEQADDPKAPDRGDQNAAQGNQHPIGFAEMENQQCQHGQNGEDEDLQNLVHVGVGPANKYGLACGVDGDVVTGLLLAELLQLRECLLVVELAFDQLCFD